MMTKLLSCPDPRECDSEADPLVSHNQGYEQYLIDRGYADGYIKCCKGGVAHLSRWMGSTQKKASEVVEALIAEFLDVHLPRCSCGSVIHDRSSLRAAFGQSGEFFHLPFVSGEWGREQNANPPDLFFKQLSHAGMIP